MNELAIDIRPATSVYGTYRRLSYKPWFAIAEFIDNSTQSYYNHKEELKSESNFRKLVIDIKYDSNEGVLEITDNAFGMNYEDFQRALILDKPPKDKKGRNEFGMGLKTAACWFGDLWSVETTELGSNKKFSAIMDIKKFEAEKTEMINPKIEYVPFEHHMTKITIKELNQKLTSNNVRKIKELLQRIYRNDLRSGEIDILWNGEKLLYDEIEIFTEVLEDGTTKEWKEEITFEVSDPYGNIYHATGWIGIQKEGKRANGGFVLLRRGRVIIGADSNYLPTEIFGTGSTYQMLYLCGELKLDDFPITQAKDGFMWDNGLEDNFISVLEHETACYVAKAKERRNENKAKKVNEFTETEINDITSSTVNKFQNVFSEKNDENVGNIFLNIKQIFKKSEEKKELTLEEIKNIKDVYQFKVDEYVINVRWDDRDECSPWITLTDNTSQNYIDIIINIRHKFFTPYQNEPEFVKLINQFAIALVLAEKQAKRSTTDSKIDPWAIRINMNKLLTDLANSKE